MRRGCARLSWPRVLACLASGAIGLAVTVPAAAPNARASAGQHTANVLPAALLAHSLGPAPADRQVSIDIALRDPNLAAEQALAAAVVDPSSPAYHRFPTPAQYAARFGLPADVRARTVSWLRSAGLRVGYTSALGDLVQATGSVAQIERLLDIGLNTYRSGPTTFRANDRAPTVPGDLPVTDVIGLNDLQRFAPADRHEVARDGQPAVGDFEGTVNVKSLWTTYDAPGADQGQGVRIGVFMAGSTEPVIGSLRAFEDAERLPKVPVRTVRAQPGPASQFAGDAAGEEWMLDSQAATGMAPKVSQLSLYAAKSLADPDILAEFARWAADPAGPAIMNASFGSCEAFPVHEQLTKGDLFLAIGNNIQGPLNKALMQAFTEGRTVFASAGDTGSSCPVVALPTVGAGNGLVNQGVPAQNFPAASPWVTAVGGTVLAQRGDHTRADEQSWAFTGGGQSLFIPEPPWQKNEPAIDRRCLPTDAHGTPLAPGTTCRGVPDVAALSGNLNQGLAIITYDTPSVIGGTSLSSPLMTGMWARVAAASKRRLGPASPAIYGLSDRARRRDFFDVTTGEAGGNGLYLPAPGWDYTSGYGVPDIARLAKDLTGRTTAIRLTRRAAAIRPEGGRAACTPFGTSPVGDIDADTFGQTHASQDISSAAMTTTANGRSLLITVRGPQLSGKVPAPAQAATVTVSWVYRGVDYTAQAVTDLAGSTTASVTDNGTGPGKRAVRHEIKARYGPGTLRMAVPLADVGAPKPGARLRYPVASTGTLTGLPGVVGLPATTDAAGPAHGYTVGRRCRAR